MPTQTFFNLPKEKQNKIMEVCKAEFSEKSFYDASINRIIKEAEISRGSFYLYFKNKEDVFLYILDGYGNEMVTSLQQSIKNNKSYDIFDVFVFIFDYITIIGMNGENKDFFKMTFSKMNMELAEHLMEIIEFPNMNNKMCVMSKIFKLDNLDIRTEKDMISIIEILKGIMLIEIIKACSSKGDVPTARESLIHKFELIKHGILKK